MKKLFGFAAIIALITISSTLFAADELESLKSRVQDAAGSLKDMRCNLVVVNSNKHELKKMGKVFAELYEFKSAKVVFMTPDNLKINGALGMVKVEFITAGNTRHIRIPSMRYKKQEDISKEQEKRMSPLDVGVVSDAIWKIYKISLVRTEKNEDGSPVYVLKLQTAKSSKYQLIWIDGKDCKLLRRDRMLGDDSLKVKTLYFDHIRVNGIWSPSKAEVYNSEGKLAATTETKNIAVNTGVEPKEFE
ncbi:MAG: outer membrane lipoprotein-sorting protein [Armatimonadota bacterium]